MAEMRAPQVLAKSDGLGSVSVCACGTVTLHVQAMSLRMDATAFAQAATMMQEAMLMLQCEPRGGVTH